MTPEPPPLPTERAYFTPLQMILIFLLFAAIALYYVAGPQAEDGEDGQQRTVYHDISAANVAAVFEENEVAAGMKFKVDGWKVTGSISEIGQDVFGAPYIVLKPGVQCILPRDSAPWAAARRKGDEVTLFCRGGNRIINVVMNCTMN